MSSELEGGALFGVLLTLMLGFDVLLQKRIMKRKIRMKFGPDKGFEENSSGILIVFVKVVSSYSFRLC